MRKGLILLCVLFLAAPLLAQHRTGNIYGVVQDEEGNPLPGVTVTLTGSKTGALSTVTSAEGNFRFLSLFPEIDYAVRLELGGFKTKIEEGRPRSKRGSSLTPERTPTSRWSCRWERSRKR